MDPRRAARPQALSASRLEFCDTNILVYAYDASSGRKRTSADVLLERLWEQRAGALSIQVLQEFFTVVTRKLAGSMPVGEARAAVERFTEWHVVEPTKQDVLAAIDRSERWRISFWDAMLVTAAVKAGASVLWSEDLSHGQTYDGVTVRNPFHEEVDV